MSQAARVALWVPSDEDPPIGRVVQTEQLTTPKKVVNTRFADATGIPEAPIDGAAYARQDGAWVESPSLAYVNDADAALQADINTRQLSAQKGLANGYASLDPSGKVPAAQLPAYVDDILEYANLAAFPATGIAGVIYVALDTSKIYRWSGSIYIEISPSPGSTDAVPEGATNLYYTDARVDARITGKADTSYVNTQLALKLNLAGGTMTGPLLLSGDATAALGAVTKQQLEAAVASGLPSIIDGGTF